MDVVIRIIWNQEFLKSTTLFEKKSVPYSFLLQANGGQAAELARLGSCFQDPQDTALDCILTRNLAGLTNILADAARLGDDDFQVEAAKQVQFHF